jgi:predicted phage gp36 major capsid-like protein
MLLQAPQETATEQWREVYHTSAKLQINPETQEITRPKIGKRAPFVYETRASLLRSDAIAFPAVSMAWNMQIHG